MIIYLLRPTPSDGRKLHLVLRLGASIVLRIDVLLGIAPIICHLMICTPPRLGTCSGCVAVLHIEAARETHVHVAVSFDDVGLHWGRVSCSHAGSRNSRDKSWHDACSHPTLACRIVCKWGAWCSASTWNDDRGPSATPTSGPSASLRVYTGLKGSNGWNVEMRKGGIVYRWRVARCVCVCIGHHLLHHRLLVGVHRLLVGVQLLDSCCDR